MVSSRFRFAESVAAEFDDSAGGVGLKTPFKEDMMRLSKSRRVD